MKLEVPWKYEEGHFWKKQHVLGGNPINDSRVLILVMKGEAAR